MSNSINRRTFWKSGLVHPLKVAIVTLLALILPAIGIVRDVVLSPENRDRYLLQYIPNWSWYWWVILILVALLVLLEETSFRAHRIGQLNLQEHYESLIDKLEQKTQLLAISADVRDVRELIGGKQAEGQPIQIHELERHYEIKKLVPNLVHLESSIVDVYEGEHSVIIEGIHEGSQNFRALTSPYHNSPHTRPPRRIGVVNGVSAEITYSFFDGSYPLTIHHGAWLSEKDNKVNFGVTTKRSLIIATIGGANELYIIEREFDGVHPEGVTRRVKQLEGDLFKVQVRLITESDGEIINKREMFLTITREPDFTIELTWASVWKLRHLYRFQAEGYDLLMKLYGISEQAHEKGKAIEDFFNAEVLAEKKKQEEAIAEQVKDWEAKAAVFIGLHLGEKQKEDFLKSAPSIDEGLHEAKKQWFFRLGESQKEKFTRSYWTLIDTVDVRIKKLDGLQKIVR
jgi:hypothetical protein